MPGEPTMWALTEAERALDHAMALSTPDHNRLRVAIARALDAAREEGRRAGLEEAVEALLEVAHTDGWCDTMQATDAIRTLATKEPT